MEVFYTLLSTPLGWVGIVKGRGGILRIFLPETGKKSIEKKIQALYPLSVCLPSFFSQEIDEFKQYFSGNKLRFSLNLDFTGTSRFQHIVWNAAQQVSYGQVRTYSWISKKVQKPRAWRAVGTALRKNPFPIVVPCHRIIRSDSYIGNFSASGGPAMKAALLRLEGVQVNNCLKIKHNLSQFPKRT